MSRSVFELRPADASASTSSVATVTGEVDVTNAEDFTKSIAALPGSRPIVVDLSRLSYLDSAGFAALDRLLADRTVLIVIAPQSPIHRAAVVMDLPFQQDTGSALQSLEARG